MVCNITLMPTGVVHAYQPGQSLADGLYALDAAPELPCGGRGTCGKCRIRAEGEGLPPPLDAERNLLTQEELNQGVRLACLVYPEGPVTVWPYGQEQDARVLAGERVRNICPDPAVKRLPFTIPVPTEEKSIEDQLLAAINGATSVALPLLQAGGFNPGQARVAHVYKGQVIRLESPSATQRTCGLAVDIGTTTVAISLLDLCTGEELAVQSSVNAQTQYGLDVLTRISYTMEQARGLAILQAAIADNLSQLAEALCRETGVGTDEIFEVVVAANNTILHILLGVDPASLGAAPFAPVFCSAQTATAKNIGLTALPNAMVYTLPSVHSYVGADIVAGAQICRLDEKPGRVLFIDIGTNGEMILADKGRLLACSCAVGPALEGMNIKCGMRAANGAVEAVVLTQAGARVAVIGGGEALGLCGSGILSAVSELLRTGMVLPSGRLQKPSAYGPEDYRNQLLREKDGKYVVQLTPSVYITQADIRQVQLAKGAILSGFYALLKRAGIEMESLDEVIIAGQFGAHLPVESLVGCGILPAELSTRIHYAGNTSHSGACAALLSQKERQAMENMADNIDYFELNTVQDYENLFAGCMSFPERVDPR